ncbi:hypothetical protein ACIP98_38290 [Streptomyces sp. NPDC088354]|uniref:hypothetical protein n=1 Tax=Streptomyces sp. NPDC088354 TaxID=3365856 RepID=UPI003805DDC3
MNAISWMVSVMVTVVVTMSDAVHGTARAGGGRGEHRGYGECGVGGHSGGVDGQAVAARCGPDAGDLGLGNEELQAGAEDDAAWHPGGARGDQVREFVDAQEGPGDDGLGEQDEAGVVGPDQLPVAGPQLRAARRDEHRGHGQGNEEDRQGRMQCPRHGGRAQARPGLLQRGWCGQRVTVAGGDEAERDQVGGQAGDVEVLPGLRPQQAAGLGGGVAFGE